MATYNEKFDEALSVFKQLERTEERLVLHSNDKLGQGIAFDLLTQSKTTAENRLLELGQTPEVQSWVEGVFFVIDRDRLDIAFLSESPETKIEAIEDLQRQLEEKEDSPEARLAGWYAGRLALKLLNELPTDETEGENGSEDVGRVEDKTLTDEFLKQPLDKLKMEIVGMGICVGNSGTATIRSVQAQDEGYNQNFSDSPIFGTNRCDAMILPSRGHNLLYIRAGKPEDLSCIRINAVDFGTRKIEGAGKVTKELGLGKNQVADVVLEGKTLRIVRVRDIKE